MGTPAKWSYIYSGCCAAITWLALIIQYVVMVNNRNISLGAVTVHFFSYFTILSNILVAVGFTFYVIKIKDTDTALKHTSFFSAICVYIIIVALIYNIVLRKISTSTGVNILLSELLHVLIPILYVIFWLYILPSGHLQLRQTGRWLIFPAIYLLYTIIHGKLSGFYPYPFTNISELGLGKVLLNCLGVAVLFWLLSALLIWVKLKYSGH